jgi:hypothetical protein
MPSTFRSFRWVTPSGETDGSLSRVFICLPVWQTTEARQLLLDAMAAVHEADPNSAVRFGFGSIYERFGETPQRLQLTARSTSPEGPINPIDTYNLARARLKGLRTN